VKDLIKEAIEKGREIEGEAELHHFVQSMIQELPEPDRKVVKECWADVQQSIQQAKEE
jgi:vacuolar-type H+-ATPase subunit H